jgi:hypothetical protein
LYREVTLRDAVVYLPAGVTGLVTLGALLFDLHWLAIVAGLVTIPLALAGTYLRISTAQFTSPSERLAGLVAAWKRRRGFPWDHTETVAESPHGIRAIREDGTAEREDGTHLALLRVEPTNTARQSRSEAETLTRQLTAALDEEIEDIPLRFWSTTTDSDASVSECHAERGARDRREIDGDPEQAALIREYHQQLAEWYDHEDEPLWEPNGWQHYVVVEAPPGSGSGLRRSSRLDILLPWRESTLDVELSRTQRQQTLANRLATVERAIGGIDGIETERVDLEEHTRLLERYFRGDHVEEAYQNRVAYRGAVTADGETVTQRALAADHFEVADEWVEVGDQYARTFWVADWPVEPEPQFLRDLYTLRGVDLDVCIRARPEDKQDKISRLAEEIARIESEGRDRQAASDVSAIDIETDIDAYVKYREVLRQTTAQPWAVSAYVTVRVDTDRARAKAQDVLDSFDSLDAAKEAALHEDSEEVRKVLEGTPAGLFAVGGGTRHHEKFVSAAPSTPDRFQEAASTDKTTSVPGSVLGAIFPFCGLQLYEETGMEWGRNLQNGELLKADPFERGTSPHIMTIGQSRSGKTYGCGKAAARWYLESDEHTLIVCDTQAGFEGLTEQAGGEHMVIDGRQAINPLDIQPVAEELRESAGASEIDPLGMKIDEGTQVISGILRSQEVDPAEYVSTIRQALSETYAQAGIKRHDLDSHAKESPTLVDFLDTLRLMLDETAEYCLSDHEAEIEQKRERVAELLEKLSGLREHGSFSHLLGETEHGLTDPEVDMAYLDLRHFQSAADAEKSVMLRLMLTQVSQKIKRTEGKVVFMIDEAHVLLHAPEMVNWLEKAAREWARYDACLWFVSQSPREFLAETDGFENRRRTIVDQCSMVQFYRTPKVQDEVLRELDLNDRQIEFIKREATPGRAGKGYSECLMQFNDKRGWVPLWVEASPFEDLMLTYSPREDGRYEEYIRSEWGEVSEQDAAMPRQQEREVAADD